VKTLYICYFGLREPLVQTQVLPYLRELARGGVGVSLLTFEPDMRRAWDERPTNEERALTCRWRWPCSREGSRPVEPSSTCAG
jgi:hypothetical protein